LGIILTAKSEFLGGKCYLSSKLRKTIIESDASAIFSFIVFSLRLSRTVRQGLLDPRRSCGNPSRHFSNLRLRVAQSLGIRHEG
jgi:hypothetical protein